MALQAGDKAPDFTLKSNAMEEVTLSEALQKGPVVLAFFPLAFSGVCTKQFTDMGKEVDSWSTGGAQVFGWTTSLRPSRRTSASNAAWAAAIG